MKKIKITYKNGNNLVLKNVYDYNVTEDYTYISQKCSSSGIADLYGISMKNIKSVEEV